MMIFYLVFFFTFSVSYSVLPLQLVYVLQFLHYHLLLFFFFDALSQDFIKCRRKALECDVLSHSVISNFL